MNDNLYKITTVISALAFLVAIFTIDIKLKYTLLGLVCFFQIIVIIKYKDYHNARSMVAGLMIFTLLIIFSIYKILNS